MAVVELPIIEAAPQDIHDDTSTGARQTIVEWRSLPRVRRETVGANVGVGVIDTAVDAHPWYEGLVQGDRVGPVDGLLSNNYKAGHATFIAGLVLEQAPAANVIVRGVLDATGHGETDTVTQEAIKLVQRKKTDGKPEIDILNLSLGCYGTDVERDQFEAMLSAVWAANPNLIVVAAAGNRRVGETRPFYPAVLAANHNQLVCVGAATDLDATLWAEFSNQGPHVTFRVCGVNLVSTFLRFTTGSGNPDGRWAKWGGTSFSTAIASGLIAARMAPSSGERRTGPQAVADLHGDAALPVSVPIASFPSPAGQNEIQPATDASLAGDALTSII